MILCLCEGEVGSVPTPQSGESYYTRSHSDMEMGKAEVAWGRFSFLVVR